MRKEDCEDLFKRIPEEMHPQVNFVLRNHFVISVEFVVRFEPNYMVLRGREGGTSDDGRAFFVSYEEICYIRIEREVRIGELKKMYGEMGYMDAEDRLSSPAAQTKLAETAKSLIDTPTPAPHNTPPPAHNGDPASIAKQNLLDRIRAARASAAGSTGKVGGGGK